MKKCSKCTIEKPLCDFSKAKKHSTGYKSACKSCLNAQERQKYAENPNKRKDYHQNFYAEHKEVYHNRYLAMKADSERAAAKKEYNDKFYYENLEYFREFGKIWRKNNPDKNARKAADYRAARLKATPNWLTEQDKLQIQSFYSEARRLTEESGIIHVVDHIIPLKGKTVCGLHVPSNLQILTESENLKKGNRFGG